MPLKLVYNYWLPSATHVPSKAQGFNYCLECGTPELYMTTCQGSNIILIECGAGHREWIEVDADE